MSKKNKNWASNVMIVGIFIILILLVVVPYVAITDIFGKKKWHPEIVDRTPIGDLFATGKDYLVKGDSNPYFESFFDGAVGKRPESGIVIDLSDKYFEPYQDFMDELAAQGYDLRKDFRFPRIELDTTAAHVFNKKMLERAYKEIADIEGIEESYRAGGLEGTEWVSQDYAVFETDRFLSIIVMKAENAGSPYAKYHFEPYVYDKVDCIFLSMRDMMSDFGLVAAPFVANLEQFFYDANQAYRQADCEAFFKEDAENLLYLWKTFYVWWSSWPYPGVRFSLLPEVWNARFGLYINEKNELRCVCSRYTPEEDGVRQDIEDVNTADFDKARKRATNPLFDYFINKGDIAPGSAAVVLCLGKGFTENTCRNYLALKELVRELDLPELSLSVGDASNDRDDRLYLVVPKYRDTVIGIYKKERMDYWNVGNTVMANPFVINEGLSTLIWFSRDDGMVFDVWHNSAKVHFKQYQISEPVRHIELVHTHIFHKVEDSNRWVHDVSYLLEPSDGDITEVKEELGEYFGKDEFDSK